MTPLNVWHVKKNDFQYFIPFLSLVFIFFCTDFLGVIEKLDFAYYSGAIISQPYRVVTTHFLHADFSHLVANIFGIVVARYFLNELSLKNRYFFIILILFLIPLQILLQWFLDIYILRKYHIILVGFSGILYGINAFILLSSIYGKKYFLLLNISLKPNLSVRKAMLFLSFIGLVWSILPTISLSAHLTGFMAGSILFLL